MSSKERLCTHCGRFIVDDNDVVPCLEGGSAHVACEREDRADWHEPATPQDLRDLAAILADEDVESEDHL